MQTPGMKKDHRHKILRHNINANHDPGVGFAEAGKYGVIRVLIFLQDFGSSRDRCITFY